MKFIPSAKSAGRPCGYVGCGNTSGIQLSPEDFHQIESRGNVEVGAFGQKRFEKRGNFRSDLKAAGADAGADGGMQRGGLRSEFRRQPRYGGAGDIVENSAPSGVDRCDGPALRIGDQDR